MANIVMGLLNGMVVETTAESWTGEYLYSDYATLYGAAEKDSFLNKWAKIPMLGIFVGITRIALGIIHTIGHLISYLYTQNRGHLFHAAKGCCEILRGFIEATPLIGRVFANLYNPNILLVEWDPADGNGARSWWMLKIYNPDKPDGLDKWMGNWKNFPQRSYIKA